VLPLPAFGVNGNVLPDGQRIQEALLFITNEGAASKSKQESVT
jgi:hypothetical protein